MRVAAKMSEAFDIYTLLFLVLAVVIFLRLRNVLGRRTGNERPSYDPFATPDAKRPGAPKPNEPDARTMISAPMVDSRLPRSCSTPWARPTVKTIRSTPTAVPRILTAVRAGL